MSNNTNTINITVSGTNATSIDMITYLVHDLLHRLGASIDAKLIMTDVTTIKELISGVDKYLDAIAVNAAYDYLEDNNYTNPVIGVDVTNNCVEDMLNNTSIIINSAVEIYATAI